MYNLDTEAVKIHDEDYFLSITNKLTGKTVTGKNHCGRINRKLYFSMKYDDKKSNVSHQECGKANAIAFALKYLGLPSYRTLKKQQKDKGSVYTTKDYNKEYSYECLECNFRGCNDETKCHECGSKEYIKL